MTSFRQQAIDRFHALVPAIALAPGIDGATAWFGGGSPGEGVVAFQLPITYQLGAQTLAITTAENVARAHREGYAWHTWLSDDGESVATWRTLIDECVDGVMTARPVAFERLLRKHSAPPACGLRAIPATRPRALLPTRSPARSTARCASCTTG